MAKRDLSHQYSEFPNPPMFKSSSGDKEYRVSIDLLGSVVQKKVKCSCNCTGWSNYRKGTKNKRPRDRNGIEVRYCKHCDEVERQMQAGIIDVPQAALNVWSNLWGGGLQPDENRDNLVDFGSPAVSNTPTTPTPKPRKRKGARPGLTATRPTKTAAPVATARIVMCPVCDHEQEWSGGNIERCNGDVGSKKCDMDYIAM